MTVKELLSRIDSKELAEWSAFFSIEPFGYFRSDVQCGVIASTIANCNRSKHSKSFTPTDFMPFGVNSEQEKMTGEQMKTVMMGIAENQSGKK
jgi:hypothetical protein